MQNEIFCCGNASGLLSFIHCIACENTVIYSCRMALIIFTYVFTEGIRYVFSFYFCIIFTSSDYGSMYIFIYRRLDSYCSACVLYLLLQTHLLIIISFIYT